MVAIDYDPVATGHISSLGAQEGESPGYHCSKRTSLRNASSCSQELLPRARRIAVFSDTSTVGQLKAVQTGAKRLGVALQVLEFTRSPYDYEGAFTESDAPGPRRCWSSPPATLCPRDDRFLNRR